MEQSLKDKIAKVYELVNRGATEGERAAAKVALDKLMCRYNISEEALSTIDVKTYRFKYSTRLDCHLLIALVEYFYDSSLLKNCYRSSLKKVGDKVLACRDLTINCNYLQFVVLYSSYEYFKRHMAKQYKIHCLPEINKCRKDKTKKKRRESLSQIFFSKYLIASNLVDKTKLEKVDLSKVSNKEYSDWCKLNKVEGGSYKTQVHSSNQLTN